MTLSSSASTTNKTLERHHLTESSRAVFLSYASQDSQAAGRICEALRAAGTVVWFDKSELRGGDAWDRSIRQQTRECVFIKKTQQTPEQELDLAVKRQKEVTGGKTEK